MAYDTFGVDSLPFVIKGTSPNLPPPSGPDMDTQYIIDIFNMSSYDVTVRWEWRRRKPPPDLAGYRIYSSQLDGTWKLRSDEKEKATVKSFKTEQYFLINEITPAVRYYYVVAYDNTDKEDGKKDESLLPRTPDPPYQLVMF